jgi:carbonic anhydrase/acetyltransferase-like protein (isoleucine patch superfamily)
MANIRSFRGLTPKLGHRVFIDESAVVIGDVEIGDDSSVWPTAVIRGDMHKIRIGTGCSIQDSSVLHITHASEYNPGGWPLIIGDRVTIGHGVILHGCTINDDVLIGNGATVLDGVEIEPQVIVGANALVPPGKKLAGGYLYTGSPCKQARPLSEKEKVLLNYMDNNYVKLKNEYLAEG